MPGQQFDFESGFDLTSLPSATQSQVMQAINQLGPLNNIGGVIWQAGTSLSATIAQGTGGSPSVTDNPRFARYVWLNTFNAAAAAPTPYYYNASTSNWTSTSIAALSITNAEIATAAAIAVTKLAAGTARHILRTNAAGTAPEYINPNSIFTNNDVPLVALDASAASGTESFLRRVAGTAVFKTFAETVTAIQNALSGVNPSVLAPGSVLNTFLGTNSAGTVIFDTLNNILSGAGAANKLNLGFLAQSGAVAKDNIRWDGSSWSPRAPAFADKMTPFITTSAELLNGTAAASGSFPSAPNNTTYRYAHGLGAVPATVRVVGIQTGVPTVGGYLTNDEVDAHNFYTITEKRDAIQVYFDATYIYVIINGDDGGVRIRQKDTPATAYSVLGDAAVWKLKLYAAL